MTLGASALYLKKDAPTYKSTAVVAISGSASSTSSNSVSAGFTPNVTAQFVTGKQVSSAAAKVLKVDDASALGRAVEVTFSSTEGDLLLTVKAASPQAAEDIANAFAQGYVNTIDQQLTTDIATYQNQLIVATNSISTLEAQPTNTLTQTQLNIAQTNYASAYSSLAAAKAQLAAQPVSVEAQAGPGASTRSSKKILGIAVLVGLLAGAGIALLRDQLDTRVRGSEDISGTVDLPVLAELPVDPDGKRRNDALPVLENPRSPFAEAMRELRTSVQVLLADVACPVIVVTSPEPSDGKTFVAANLAVSWALAGKRTVVVSADVRRNHLDEVFSSNVPAEGLVTMLDAGLDPYLRGPGGPSRLARDATPVVADYLWLTDVDLLLLLPAGTTQRDPADLLASRAMLRVLDELRAISDVVIIDTPPTLAVTDAAILASLADGAVVVISADRTNHGLLGQTVKRLEAAEGKVLGVALNRSRTATSTAYSYYSNSETKTPGPSRRKDNSRATASADTEGRSVTAVAAPAAPAEEATLHEDRAVGNGATPHDAPRVASPAALEDGPLSDEDDVGEEDSPVANGEALHSNGATNAADTSRPAVRIGGRATPPRSRRQRKRSG